jgi:hypothetical protein
MIHICHKCSFRHRPCAGPCPCLADPQKRDIMVMCRLPVEELPEKCPIRSLPASERGKAMRPPEDVVMSPEEAAKESKRSGCCGHGENAG